MRLLANENIPLASIKELRAAGSDVLSVAEDYRGEDDCCVLSIAANEHRILIAFDHDYGESIFRGKMPAPPAVLYLRFIPATPASLPIFWEHSLWPKVLV